MSTLLEQASLVMIPSGYKEDVVYSQIPTSGAGDLSFTRASNGTRINSAGLVEVCPWNMLQYSEDFAQAPPIWNKYQATITSNTTTAPNGTLTADSIIDNSANDVHIAYQDRAGIVAGTYTISAYAKASTLSHINLQWYDGTTFYTSNAFNLSNGTTTGANQSIESVGNGWYRCIFTFTTTVSGTQYAYVMTNNGTSNVYIGTGQSVFIWGAQLNIGSTAKPYFPTTDRLNVPRLTYQNGGGGCPSLLLEKQSTNLITYSEQFDNAAYTTANNNGTITRTANYGVSPDGTQNADRIQLTRGSGSFDYAQVYQQISTTSGTHTFSCWLKSLSGTPSIGWAYNDAVWDVVTLTSEWVRYTWTTTTNTTPSVNLIIYGSLATPLSADFLIWGYQIEASSYPTSYIQTTSSSATRVADVCSKTSISSLIGQSEGVLFCDFNITEVEPDTNYLMVANISDGTTNNRLGFARVPSGGIHIYVVVSGASQFTFNTTQTTGRFKLAITYKANDYAVYLNGTSIYTNTSASVPSSMSRFDLGNLLGIFISKVTINQAALFKTRLTNAELASLTTI